MRYTIKGYTGRNADFTDVIELPDDFNFEAFDGSREAYELQAKLKAALLDSSCDTEYLNVMDDCAYDYREDLADFPGQIVLIAESFGCDNCSDTGNDWTDGCNDEPHGAFMITFDPLK